MFLRRSEIHCHRPAHQCACVSLPGLPAADGFGLFCAGTLSQKSREYYRQTCGISFKQGSDAQVLSAVRQPDFCGAQKPAGRPRHRAGVIRPFRGNFSDGTCLGFRSPGMGPHSDSCQTASGNAVGGGTSYNVLQQGSADEPSFERDEQMRVS